MLQIARDRKIPLALFKADIHKAFDTLSLEFLIKIMENMGFPDKLIQWMKNCVLRGSSQIIINGLRGKRLQLKWGG